MYGLSFLLRFSTLVYIRFLHDLTLLKDRVKKVTKEEQCQHRNCTDNIAGWSRRSKFYRHIIHMRGIHINHQGITDKSVKQFFTWTIDKCGKHQSNCREQISLMHTYGKAEHHTDDNCHTEKIFGLVIFHFEKYDCTEYDRCDDSNGSPCLCRNKQKLFCLFMPVFPHDRPEIVRVDGTVFKHSQRTGIFFQRLLQPKRKCYKHHSRQRCQTADQVTEHLFRIEIMQKYLLNDRINNDRSKHNHLRF